MACLSCGAHLKTRTPARGFEPQHGREHIADTMMPPTTLPPTQPTPHLAGVVIDQARQLSQARDECRGWRQMLEQALALIAERDRELKCARSTIEFQRREIRALIVTGKGAA